jgi:hypothetical protein
MRKMRKINKDNIRIIILFTILFLFGIPAFCFAAEDIGREIGMLKEEIKTAQAKLDKAKLGQTLEAITFGKIRIHTIFKTEHILWLSVGDINKKG